MPSAAPNAPDSSPTYTEEMDNIKNLIKNSVEVSDAPRTMLRVITNVIREPMEQWHEQVADSLSYIDDILEGDSP